MDDDTDSLFEQLQAEVVPPLQLELPDGDDIAAWTIGAVDSAGLMDLDPGDGAADVIEGLLGEDIGDDVLDVLEPLDWSHTLDLARLLRRHFHVPALPGDVWAWLIEQIDLFGEDIETDLAEHRGGTDLLDWFRGLRPWPQLARFIGRLPEGCRYRAAVLDDEDLARERLENEDPDEPEPTGRPGLVGETQALQLARATVSALMRVEHAVYAAQAPKSKRGRPPESLKGPETAEDRLRDELGDAEVEDIFDQVTPGWRDQTPPSGFQQTDSGLYVPDDA